MSGTSRYEVAPPGTHHRHFGDEASGTVEPSTGADLEHPIAAAAQGLGPRMPVTRWPTPGIGGRSAR